MANERIDWSQASSIVAGESGCEVQMLGASKIRPSWFGERIPGFPLTEQEFGASFRQKISTPQGPAMVAPTMYRHVKCSWWEDNSMYQGPKQPLAASYYQPVCQVLATWSINDKLSPGIVLSGYDLVSASQPHVQRVCDTIEKRVGVPGNYSWEVEFSTCEVMGMPLKGYDLKPSG